MAPKTGTDERYSVALGELWVGSRPDAGAARRDRGRARAARRGRRGDGAAASPVRAPPGRASTSYGLEPPPAAASAHAELADALACARDATAEVAEAVSIWGAEGVDTLLHEWRGALFRVRLARLRLAAPAPRAVAEEEHFKHGFGWPLAAFTLALVGALAFVAGATLRLWPLWVAGLVAVCALGRRLPALEQALRRPRRAEPREALLAAEQLDALEQPGRDLRAR